MRQVKVLVVGPQGSGKTSLIQNMVDSTIKTTETSINFTNATLKFIESPHQSSEFDTDLDDISKTPEQDLVILCFKNLADTRNTDFLSQYETPNKIIVFTHADEHSSGSLEIHGIPVFHVSNTLESYSTDMQNPQNVLEYIALRLRLGTRINADKNSTVSSLANYFSCLWSSCASFKCGCFGKCNCRKGDTVSSDKEMSSAFLPINQDHSEAKRFEAFNDEAVINKTVEALDTYKTTHEPRVSTEAKPPFNKTFHRAACFHDVLSHEDFDIKFKIFALQTLLQKDKSNLTAQIQRLLTITFGDEVEAKIEKSLEEWCSDPNSLATLLLEKIDDRSNDHSESNNPKLKWLTHLNPLAGGGIQVKQSFCCVM